MSTFAEYRDWLVVEATHGFGAGAIAAKILGDLGCTVVRLTDGDELDRDVRALVDGSKHPLGVAYGDPRARPVLDALLAAAQVLVVDRAGLAALRSAFGASDFATRFPALTVCACTPFGLTGPYAEWDGGEELVQAVAGIMSITGHPGSGPTRIAGAPLTAAAAMLAVSSILADRVQRRTGQHGDVLDVAVYDAALAFQSASLPALWLSGRPPQGIGNRHSMAAPWNSFRCADGWVIICAGNHPTWVRLCEAIGRPDLLDDPRFASQGERVAHVDALEAEVTAFTQNRSVAEVESCLNAGTIATGSVLPLPDVLAHPQVGERGLLRDGCLGGVFHLGGRSIGAQPAPGGTARAILLERCGVRASDLAQWRAAGVLHQTKEQVDAAAA